jgi:4-amino-4-deoxy-L-arabinose transferase-like glycosyltransferase
MKKILLLLLIAAAAFFALANLGKWALMDADEATYARVYQESAAQHDLVSLTFLGHPWHEKPPLYFWLTKGSVSLFGQNEFALRLPSALAIVLAVWLVWLIAYHESKSAMTAFVAGMVLVGTGFFMFAGRQMRLDVPVTAALLGAFYCFLRGEEKPKWLMGVGFLLGVAVLLKSVIGLLGIPIILLYALMRKRWGWLASPWFWVGNGLGLLVALPWHVYELMKFGGPFWQVYFTFNVVERVSGVVVTGSQVAPFFYHLKQLLIVTGPWLGVFLGIAGGAVAWHFLRTEKTGQPAIDRAGWAYIAITLFLLVVFYIPQTRLLYYFIPALPFLAISIALSTRALLDAHRYVVGSVLVLLCAFGMARTAFAVFSQQDRGFFLQALPRVSRYQVAEDERRIAHLRTAEQLPLYLYKWNFVTTFLYYNDGGNGVSLRRADAATKLEGDALLLVPTPLFKGLDALPIAVTGDAKREVVYAGLAGTVVKISD